MKNKQVTTVLGSNATRSMLRAIIAALFLMLGFQPAMRAELVSWSFSGVIDRTYSPGPLPDGIAEGTPFTGIFTYSTTMVEPPIGTPLPGRRTYYFTNAEGSSVWMRIGSHTITSATPAPFGPMLAVVVASDYGTTDEFAYDNGVVNFRFDGASFPEDAGGGFSIYLTDTSKQAFSTSELPVTAPVLSGFTSARIGFGVSSAQAGQSYSFYGAITNISGVVQPVLDIRHRLDAKARVSWPRAARGFQLQSADTLDAASWQPVPTPVVESDADYSVVVNESSGKRFYRLLSTR